MLVVEELPEARISAGDYGARKQPREGKRRAPAVDNLE
jgi:hypothetical protein